MLLSKKISTITLSLCMLINTYFAYSLYKQFFIGKPSVYHVSIVAAHNEKIKELVIPFLKQACKKKFHADLQVEWIKHGGQNTNVKVIHAKYKENRGASCGYDIVWGGGAMTAYGLEKAGLLAPLCLKESVIKNLPDHMEVTIYTPTWVAACLSSFGIIYNQVIFKEKKIPIPTRWEDLARTDLFDKVVNVDPCQSSNAWTIYAMILQAYGWEKGWSVLTKMAGNTICFIDKSSNATTSVVQGIGLLAPTNDFYAQGSIDIHGKQNLAFMMPKQETIINADPIAILKGAPNPRIAKFCIECILSAECQALLMLKKKTAYGPRNYTLGRIAVNKKAYSLGGKSDVGCVLNPFSKGDNEFIELNNEQASKQYPVVSALFKAYCIIPHKKLKQAWQIVIQQGCQPEDIKMLTSIPISEQEIQKLIKLWKDPIFRHEKMTMWTAQAEKRYDAIIVKYRRSMKGDK